MVFLRPKAILILSPSYNILTELLLVLIIRMEWLKQILAVSNEWHAL